MSKYVNIPDDNEISTFFELRHVPFIPFLNMVCFKHLVYLLKMLWKVTLVRITLNIHIINTKRIDQYIGNNLQTL